MKKKIIIGIIIAALVGGVIYLKVSAASQKKYVSVKTSQVAKGDVKSYLSTTAVIKSNNTKDYYGIAAKAKNVNVKVGDKVTKGQVLVTYDVDDLANSVKQQEISLSNSMASKQDQITTDSQNTFKLTDQGVDQQLADYTNRLAAKEAQLADANGKVPQDVDAQIDKLSDQIKDLDNQTAAIDSQIVPLDQKIAPYDDQIKPLNDKTSALDVQMAQLDVKIADIDGQSIPIDNQIASIDSQIADLNNQLYNNNTTENSNKITPQINILSGQKGVLQAQKSPLSTQKTSLQTQKSNLQAQKTTIQSQITNLQNDKSVYQTQKTNLQNEKTNLQNQKTNLQTQKSNLESLKSDAKTFQSERDTYVSSINNLKAQKLQLQPSTDSKLKQLDNAIELAKVNLDAAKQKIDKNQDSIVAEFDGVVTAVNAVEGAVGNTGQIAVTVQDLDNLKGVVSVGKYDAPKLKVGQSAVIKNNGKEYKGVVTKIDPIAQKTTSTSGTDITLSLDVNITDKPEGLKVDFETDIDILLSEADGSIKIPIESIKSDKTGRSYVYVIDGEKAVEKNVKIGIQSDTDAQITEGIEAGQKVILNPSIAIKNGVLVKDSVGVGK